VGWDGIGFEEIATGVELRDGRLWMTPRPGKPSLRIATTVDGPRFEETWLDSVERLAESS
jgi:hypothetical protein